MKKRDILIGTLSLGLILFSCVGSTLSYWNTSSSTINKVSMNFLKNEIAEEYNEPDYVMPSETVKKVVNVENTGSVDSIVRVKVTLLLGSIQNDKFQEDLSLDSSNIEIPYNTNYWTYDKNDGYFYYNAILQAGQKTREPLFEEFTLNESITNTYKDKIGKVVIDMECLQADNNAISLWYKTYEDLEITPPSEKEDVPTTVTYLGVDKKFDIELHPLDLFSNFKDMTPGCTRTQRIQVRNESSETVNMYLAADMAMQEWETPKEAVSISNLLNKYAMIKITDEEKNILYDGPISGNLDSNANTMKVGIDLGQFKNTEMKTFVVTLSLHPLMGNEYQSLLGKIKWIFAINGADTNIEEYKPSGDGSVSTKDEVFTNNKTSEIKEDKIQGTIEDGKASRVKTADSHMKYAYIFALGLGFIGILYVYEKKRKEK